MSDTTTTPTIAEALPTDAYQAPVVAAPGGMPTAAELRAASLDADDLGGQLVKVPEWDKPGQDWSWEVWVRGLAAEERNQALQSANAVAASEGRPEGADTNTFYAFVVVLTTLHPATKERIFGSDDALALLKKSAKAVDRLASVALTASGMTKESVEEAIAEAGKGSSSTGSDDSSSR